MSTDGAPRLRASSIILALTLASGVLALVVIFLCVATQAQSALPRVGWSFP